MSLFKSVLSFGLLFAGGVSIVSGQREYWLNIHTADYDYCDTVNNPGVAFVNSAGVDTGNGGSIYQLNPGGQNEWANVTFTTIDIGEIEQLWVNMGSLEWDAFCFDRFEFGITSDPTGEIIGRGCSMEYQTYARVSGDCTIGDGVGAARRLYINISDTSPICWNLYNNSLTNKTDIPYIKNDGFSQFTEAQFNDSIQRTYEFNFTTLVASTNDWDCGSSANVIMKLQSNCTFHELGTINNPSNFYSQCIEDRVVETTQTTFVPADEGETRNVQFIDSDIGDPTHLYLSIGTSQDYYCLGEFDILLKPNFLSEDGISGDKWVHCNVAQILQEGVGLDDNCHNTDFYTGGVDEITLRIDEYAPYCQVYYVATPAPTFIPTYAPTDYDCYIGEDDVIVSWDDLTSGENGGNNFTANIELKSGTNNDTNTFEVSVTVESKYVIGATMDAFKDYYRSVTNNGYLGITYVLDTNEFSSNGRLLENANTCENRLSSSFNNSHFLNDYWTYTLSPNVENNNRLGNDDYGLEYGNQNIWSISMDYDEITNNDTCGNVVWTNTFSFYDLWHTCKDSNNEPSYELIETDDTISLNLNFYLTLVSPNPLYLESCDNGETDCGQYIIKQLISHPLSIVFSKRQSIISTKDQISIDLFTSHIVSLSFSEDNNNDNNSSGIFKLEIITSVPNFMSLNIDTALILSPSDAQLMSLNNGLDFINDITISEDTSFYSTNPVTLNQDCSILSDYRCWQKFDILIDINQCPSDTGLLFDGDYFFSADFDCISNDTSICDDYISDEPLSITLDSNNLKYSELCDSTVYEIDWNGDITFYSNSSFNDDNIEDTFELGDEVFVRVSIENDIGNYQIFGMDIITCYICTSNISNNDTSVDLESCITSPQVDDNSLMYNIPQSDDLSFTLINSNTSDTHEDFSFVLPPVADDIFYLDCTVELTINNVINNNRRRTRRSLLQVSNGNTFENFVGQGKVAGSGGNNNNNNNEQSEEEEEGESDDSSNNNNNNLLGSSSGVLMVVITSVVGALLVGTIIGIIYYFKVYQVKQQKLITDTLKQQQQMPTMSNTASTRQSIDNTV